MVRPGSPKQEQGILVLFLISWRPSDRTPFNAPPVAWPRTVATGGWVFFVANRIVGVGFTREKSADFSADELLSAN